MMDSTLDGRSSRSHVVSSHALVGLVSSLANLSPFATSGSGYNSEDNALPAGLPNHFCTRQHLGNIYHFQGLTPPAVLLAALPVFIFTPRGPSAFPCRASAGLPHICH